AVYGNGEQGIELALLISNWSRDLVLCTNGPTDIGMQQRMQLIGRGIVLREEPIARLERRQGDSGEDLMSIVFANGEVLTRRGLFFRPRQRQHSYLPEQLGCTFTSSGAIAVDESSWTGVPGLYAAGDAAQLLQQVAFAAASGARAAIAINIGLIQDEVEQYEAE
ncbi:MAG TPA: FAD-dependent oxidoreductase, partial [Ktedonobacteraceae bacterium]|nr:FAD-dependent oxidoreductase [Ktedonobacteraceae bacterium]